MEAAGVKSDYCEYFMGHLTSVYHDIEPLGIEKLRSIYENAGLSIQSRTTVAKLDLIREFAKGIDVHPDKVQIEPDVKFLDPQENERAHTSVRESHTRRVAETSSKDSPRSDF